MDDPGPCSVMSPEIFNPGWSAQNITPLPLVVFVPETISPTRWMCKQSLHENLSKAKDDVDADTGAAPASMSIPLLLSFNVPRDGDDDDPRDFDDDGGAQDPGHMADQGSGR